jgi:hypothetical protein
MFVHQARVSRICVRALFPISALCESARRPHLQTHTQPADTELGASLPLDPRNPKQPRALRSPRLVRSWPCPVIDWVYFAKHAPSKVMQLELTVEGAASKSDIKRESLNALTGNGKWRNVCAGLLRTPRAHCSRLVGVPRATRRLRCCSRFGFVWQRPCLRWLALVWASEQTPFLRTHESAGAAEDPVQSFSRLAQATWHTKENSRRRRRHLAALALMARSRSQLGRS